MKNTVFCILLTLCIVFSVAADDPKEQVQQAKDYQTALTVVDNVIANIVLVRTPTGDRGFTRGDVDELRRCTLLLQAALKELEGLKNPPAPTEPVESKLPPEAPK